MNSIAETCMHVFVWCCRVRHRRGYGVHSPYAYNLIKQVFFETETFYAYEELLAYGRARTQFLADQNRPSDVAPGQRGAATAYLGMRAAT